MKILKEHIKSGDFKPFYLLYGSEDYLKKLYRNRLKTAILGDQADEMNLSYYEGKDLDLKSMVEVSQTLPFFRDKRLIIVEKSGLFKSQSDLPEKLSDLPDSTVIIFVETEVDKRSKLFKMVRDKGIVTEMNGLDENNLKLFVVSLLEPTGKRITENTITLLLERTGTDMENIRNEVEKLICYAKDKDIITAEDVEAIVTAQIQGKIFQLTDSIGQKQQHRALELYFDLLSVREKPMTILYLMIRHFHILMQIKELNSLGVQSLAISEKVGIPPFAVSKYISQARNFTMSRLKEALEYGTDMEEQVKTGKIIDRMAIELFLVTFCRK